MAADNDPGNVAIGASPSSGDSGKPDSASIDPADASERAPKPSLRDSPWIVYATTMVTILSFVLNAYLLYDKLSQRAIDQPPPILSRIQMTSLKATVLEFVASKQEKLLSLFPQVGIVSTALWKQQVKAAESLSPGEREAKQYRFLVVRNPSNALTYRDIRLSAETGSEVAVIDALPPASTRLVLLDDASRDSRINAAYRLTGRATAFVTALPATTGREIVMLVDMNLTELYSLAGLDDRARMLIEAMRPRADGELPRR
jgi:hypothetical protein